MSRKRQRLSRACLDRDARSDQRMRLERARQHGSGADSALAKAGKAAKFASCMRKNGVSQFPDPPASGNFTIDEIANGSSLNTNSPGVHAGAQRMQGAGAAGFTGTKRSTQQQQAALKFAQCMRENGVSDFPDPVSGQPLVDTNHIPSAQPAGRHERSERRDAEVQRPVRRRRGHPVRPKTRVLAGVAVLVASSPGGAALTSTGSQPAAGDRSART